MSALAVPDAGLSLCRDHPDATPKPTHAMRLNLAQHTVDDLIQSLRENKLARIRFGKHQTLYYGSKLHHFHSAPETHRSEIYSAGPADKENIYFSGILSHRLEVQKAQEATAATDQALANLEQSLNAYEQGKESKKTHMINDINEVKGIRGKQSRPASKVELEKDRLLKTSASRSVSTSPLGAAATTGSPANLTSAPVPQNKDRIRLDALKFPFIHLLAVRAVSVKFLARQTRASVEDCSTLAQKYGIENRINRDKFDLKDKAYRELDVWNFPYPSQEDRDEAIENAISAFDRMRISRSDKQWQTLLPKEDRGKGKCLSRLNLRTGPIKKPATSSATTPLVQSQGAEDTGKDGYSTGHETDKTSSGEKTADVTATASKSGAVTATQQKKRVGEKDAAAAKRVPTKGKSTTNTTLTGRVTKKAERKPPAKPDGKIKSAEYVRESDEEEDMDMPDASTVTEKPQQKKTDTTEKPQPKPAPKQRVGSNAPGTTHPVPKAEKSERPPAAKHEPPSQSAVTKSTTGLKKPPSSARATNSNSPQKPSPLGSSPPANASEIRTHSRSSSQNYASSSSSSPLITQLSRPKQQTTSSGATKATRTNGSVKKTEASNPLKRKAEADRLTVPQSNAGVRANATLEHKRRRAVSTSSGGSTGSASPPLSYELLRQQLREKSQKFKNFYSKYRTLHDSLATHPDPPRAELDRLNKQHKRLQLIKKEIWDEDRRLRESL